MRPLDPSEYMPAASAGSPTGSLAAEAVEIALVEDVIP
jgi:hypothetical protein